MNQLISHLISAGKGVAQGSCLGPTLFLLFHSELPQSVPSASDCHLFADDVAVIIYASLWWHRTHFVPQMQHVGQKVLYELARCAANWKQPINLSTSQWQWIHRRVTIPNLSLSHLKINRPNEHLSFRQYCKNATNDPEKFSDLEIR